MAGRGGDGVQNQAGKLPAPRGRECGELGCRNWGGCGCGFAVAARRARGEEEGVDGEHVPDRAQDAGDGWVGGEEGDGEGFVQQVFELNGVVGAVMGEDFDQPAAAAREMDRRRAGAAGLEGAVLAGAARAGPGAGGEVGRDAVDAFFGVAEAGPERPEEAGVAGIPEGAGDQASEAEQDHPDPAEQVGGGVGQGGTGRKG